MKSRALFLSLFVASGGWASAQTDPFQRTAPTVAPPLVTGQAPELGSAALATPTGRGPADTDMLGTMNTGTPDSGIAGNSGIAGSDVMAQGRRSYGATFGQPRSSSGSGRTKVVFDLPAGVRYALSPSYTGLSIRVQGAGVQPAARGALGPDVSSYRAGGSQVTLTTPHPLSASGGWKASEATIASGSRVLILEFGNQVSGGVTAGGLQAMLPGTQPAALAIPASPMANAAGNAALSRSSSYRLPAKASTGAAGGCDCPDCCEARAAGQPMPHAGSLSLVAQAAGPTSRATVPTRPIAAQPITAKPVAAINAPGDDVAPQVVTPPPPLKQVENSGMSMLSGQVPGQSGNNVLVEPRVGKHPGMTRVVLDLPAGASYRLQPSQGGMQIYLSGVRASPYRSSSVSGELSSWAFQPQGSGVTVSLNTTKPLTEASGWRAFFLPPSGGGGRYRLAIDIAPALANLRPLAPNERSLPYLAGPRSSGGSLAYASNVRPVVVLDPGHGGRDSGAVGMVTEEDVVLEVAKKTRAFLNAAGIDVVMTRDRDATLSSDKATDLRMRANMGARGTNFVSIHANALPASTAIRGYGVETWYNKNHKLSGAFASILQKNMVDTSGAFSRGVKNHQSLGVLRTNKVPAALVEIGFVSHPVDGLNLQDQNYLDRVAMGIAKGLHQSLRTGVNAAGSQIVGQSGAVTTE